MNGFEKRAEKKKNDILQATKKLFLNHGSSHLCVSQIAKNAKVSQVTIFKFFGTKSHLIEEAILDYTNELIENIEKVTNGPGTFHDKVKQFLFLKSQMAKELHEEVYTTYIRLVNEKNPRLISIMSRNDDLAKALFEQGKSEGSINTSISNDALNLYLQLLSQAIYSNDNIIKVIPLIDDIMDLICFGFIGKQN